MARRLIPAGSQGIFVLGADAMKSAKRGRTAASLYMRDGETIRKIEKAFRVSANHKTSKGAA